MGSGTARHSLGPSLAKFGLVVSEKMSKVDISSNWVVINSIEQKKMLKQDLKHWYGFFISVLLKKINKTEFA